MHTTARISNLFDNDLLMYIARRDFFISREAFNVYTDLTICSIERRFQPYHEDYGIDNQERRIHCCPDYLTVNGAPQLLTHNVVVCQHEVRQLQAQVLDSLVETGMIIHKPSQSRCSHPALQLKGGVKSVDIRPREHDLLISVEAQPSNDPDEFQRVL